MQVKIKKLSDAAVLPTYAINGDAGMDLTAVSEKIFMEHGITYIEYGTGLAFEIPTGHVGLLFPRSSISSNTMLTLSNSVGVLDSNFRNEVTFRFKPLVALGAKKYKIGERIGQILVVPYPEIEFVEVQELSTTERTGGYGHTGK